MKILKPIIDPKTGDIFIDLAAFQDILNITKVASYTLEEVDDDGERCLILKFYDKKGKHLKCKTVK